jgi:hypothetical protein
MAITKRDVKRAYDRAGFVKTVSGGYVQSDKSIRRRRGSSVRIESTPKQKPISETEQEQKKQYLIETEKQRQLGHVSRTEEKRYREKVAV